MILQKDHNSLSTKIKATKVSKQKMLIFKTLLHVINYLKENTSK